MSFDGWGLVVQIKQAVAEHARREASYRTRRGLEGRALAGKTAGGRAYGYIPASQSKSGQDEIDEREATIVRRIFTEYAAGLSPRRIAARLNAEYIPSPGAAWRRTDTGKNAKRRGKWVASAIHGDPKRGYGILNNERYIGKLIWGRMQWKRGASDSKKRTAVAVPNRSQWVIHDDERLRIVSQDLWVRVKARQSARTVGAEDKRRSRAGKPVGTLLSGILICGDCGSRFIASDKVGYQCASRTYGGTSACANTLRVKRDRAENAVIEYISEELLSSEAVALAQKTYQNAMREVLSARQPTVAKPDQLIGEETQLRQMLKAGTLSSEAVNAALAALEQKRRKVDASRATPINRRIEALPLAAERYKAAVCNLANHIAGTDQAAEARTLVRELLGGAGTVFTKNGRTGARFPAVSLVDLAEFSLESGIYNSGSGGRI